MKSSAINPGRAKGTAVEHRFLSLGRMVIVGSVVVWFVLLPTGCHRESPSTNPDTGAVKREAEALKKQNEDMIKRRR
jgi:hypothetical protein